MQHRKSSHSMRAGWAGIPKCLAAISVPVRTEVKGAWRGCRSFFSSSDHLHSGSPSRVCQHTCHHRASSLWWVLWWVGPKPPPRSRRIGLDPPMASWTLPLCCSELISGEDNDLRRWSQKSSVSQLDREGAERGPHDPLRSFPTPCCLALRCHHRCRTSYWAILVAASGVDCRVLRLGSPRTNTGLPWWLSGKESACQCRRHRRRGFHPWVRNIHRRRKWQSTPVCLPGKPHGQGSLMGYSPWDHKELDTTY